MALRIRQDASQRGLQPLDRLPPEDRFLETGAASASFFLSFRSSFFCCFLPRPAISGQSLQALALRSNRLQHLALRALIERSPDHGADQAAA